MSLNISTDSSAVSANVDACTPWEAGVSLVEFCIGVVVFAVLVGSLIQFGLSIFQKNQVETSIFAAMQEVRLAYTHRIVPKGCAQILRGGFNDVPCQKLAECADNVIINKVSHDVLHRVPRESDARQIDVSTSVLPTTLGTQLSVQGSFAPQCLFCSVFPTYRFSVGQETAIQNQNLCIQ